MPVKVTAWKCVWRCGRKCVMRREAMVEHEARCALNPDVMTCRTCAHEDIDNDPEAGRWRGCELELLPDIYEEQPEPWERKSGEPETCWTKCKTMVLIRGCGKWEEAT